MCCCAPHWHLYLMQGVLCQQRPVKRSSTLPFPVLQGVHITLRMRLLCEICRAGEAAPQQTYEVMNEVVLDRGANPYLTKIECWEHDRLITKVSAVLGP